MFLSTVGVGGAGEQKAWLDELQKRRQADALSLQVIVHGVPQRPAHIKIYAFELPRAGSRLFLEGTDVADRVGIHVKSAKKWFRQNLHRTWMPALQRLGMPEDHILWGSCGWAASEAQAFIVPQTSVSLLCLLHLLVLWQTLALPAPVIHIDAAFLASLLSLAPTKFGVSVAPSKRLPSVGSLAFDLVVEDGTLQAAPGVAECMLGVSSPEA